MKTLITRLFTRPFTQLPGQLPARLLAVLLLSAAALLPVSVTGAEQPHTLLVYGDSLSAAYGIAEEQGWVNLLRQKIHQQDLPYRVVNGSVSGETSSGGLARLPAMLESYQPDLVILELGGNDGLRGLPVSNLKANLLAMVEMIKDSGARVLLAGIQIPPNYGPRYTEPFYQVFGDIAEQQNLALVPFLIDGIPQQPQLMQNDGIHPRAEAQAMILDNVWPTLEPLLKDRRTD
jgi:acyl-CoA thioesterase-1